MSQDLYEKLLERKNNGEKLDWDSITRDELEDLFENNPDSLIASLYDVDKSKVTAKRKKWNIRFSDYIIEKVLNDNNIKNMFENLNQSSKDRLLDKNNIDTLSIALAYYLLSGTAEDILNEKLSQNDIDKIIEHITNKIDGILDSLHKEKWLNLELLLNSYSIFGKNKIKPIPNTDEIDSAMSKLGNNTNN